MNESSLSWSVCAHVVFLWVQVQYDIPWPHGLHINEPHNWRVTQCVTCYLFSNNFNFYFQLLNSVQVGAADTNSEVAPKEINAGIHVWWTWWPGPPTNEALWKSTQQDTATKHIRQDALLEKCCVYMPCSLNDWNVCMLTCAFPSHLSSCHRQYQKFIQTFTPHSSL